MQLLPGDISLNPEPNRINHLLSENLKVFQNMGLHFIPFIHFIHFIPLNISFTRDSKSIKCDGC